MRISTHLQVVTSDDANLSDLGRKQEFDTSRSPARRSSSITELGRLKHPWSLTLSEAVTSSPKVHCHPVRIFLRWIKPAARFTSSGMRLAVLIHATVDSEFWEIGEDHGVNTGLRTLGINTCLWAARSS